MNLYKKIIDKYKELHIITRYSFVLGILTLAAFYITALFAYLIAPGSADYFAVMNVYRGCIEAAPASLAAGVCAGLFGDLMLRKNDGESKHDSGKK